MKLIDADALWMDVIHSMDYCDDILEFIERQPTIEPGQKKGRWIFYESENDRYDDIKCPFCKKSYTVDAYRIDDIGFTAEDFNYCPNCGADMRGEDSEEEGEQC